MNRRGRKQGRDGDVVCIHAAIGKYQDIIAFINRSLGFIAELAYCLFHAIGTCRGRIADVQCHRTEGPA